jgi:hypothetical protein
MSNRMDWEKASRRDATGRLDRGMSEDRERRATRAQLGYLRILGVAEDSLPKTRYAAHVLINQRKRLNAFQGQRGQ